MTINPGAINARPLSSLGQPNPTLLDCTLYLRQSLYTQGRLPDSADLGILRKVSPRCLTILLESTLYNNALIKEHSMHEVVSVHSHMTVCWL